MQQLDKLLKINDSQLALVLRLGLYGLRAQLKEALKTSQVISDPGFNVCEELIEELNRILEVVDDSPDNILEVVDDSPDDILEPVNDSSDGILEPVNDSPDGIGKIVEPIALKLGDISEILILELSNYIGQYQFNSTNDADLWNEMHLLLLRVPQQVATTWGEKLLKEANKKGAKEDKRTLRRLPFIHKEDLYYGLTGSIKAQGLRLSDQVKCNPLLRVETQGEDLDFLARVVSSYIDLIELDSSLHHALKKVNRFGVKSLQLEEQKSRYVEALIDSFHRVQATVNADPAHALKAQLDLDEAIHSLVFYPPAQRFSWWGKLQQQVRHKLDYWEEKARQAGNKIEIRQLWGPFADVQKYSKDELQINTGGVPGEVSACLRVYAKINEEELPGRVIFRASSYS